MDDREQRGLAIAALFKIDHQADGKWLVPSQSGNGTRYIVDPNPEHPTCDCPDHRDRGIKCKHMFAVEFAMRRETHSDGSVTIERTVSVREQVTYKQNWPAYNKAQTTEKHRFQVLLHELCAGIPEPPRPPGRPPMPIADMLFSIVFKTYCGFSTRRLTCDLDDARTKGYITKTPHFNSVLNYLEKPFVTPILHRLIAESSAPLRSVESDFTVDSSGFTASRYVRWFDVKYGKTMEEHDWVKVHVMTGVNTNVVTAVEILDKNAADSPQLPPLLTATKKRFSVREVSADAAYLSVENVEAIDAAGATPFIAFKENSTGAAGGLFAKMYHFYSFHRDEFLKHYHKRSNAESTFSMIKAKFHGHIRCKTDTAMKNEALCKILAHNICCLIQSQYELGIEATFWGQVEEPVAVASLPGPSEGIEQWAWV